jgi:hypothetical protein
VHRLTDHVENGTFSRSSFAQAAQKEALAVDQPEYFNYLSKDCLTVDGMDDRPVTVVRFSVQFDLGRGG